LAIGNQPSAVASVTLETLLRRRRSDTRDMPTTIPTATSNSFILRLERRGRAYNIKLTDLHTAEKLEFESLEAFVVHLLKVNVADRLR
jgi:hypothetical protein